MTRALLPLLALVLAGCITPEQTSIYFAHEVEVERDTLGKALERPKRESKDKDSKDKDSRESKPDPRRIGIDLTIDGFAGDSVELLRAWFAGLERHPAIEVRSIAIKGVDAYKGPQRPKTEGAAPGVPVTIGCKPEFHGTVVNGFIAFPGMIPFLPIWLGYSWELDLETHFSVDGQAVASKDEIEFTERNAPRSAIFHLWPSTGFFGTQFVLGIVLSPTMCFYDGEQTTPKLVTVLEPRLGDVLADRVFRVLESRQAVQAAAPSNNERGR